MRPDHLLDALLGGTLDGMLRGLPHRKMDANTMYLSTSRIRSAGRTSGSIEITLPPALQAFTGLGCRVTVRDGRIVMHWVRSNMPAHEALIAKTRAVMRKAGFPIVLSHTFGRKTTSHQCGTARLGDDPHTSVVDPDCRSHDVNNLYITDASVLPTSAAVNPALTIAALALKAGASILDRRDRIA